MLIDRVDAVLNDRLARDLDRPLAVALSGGGDSLALLMMTAGWARRHGRRVIALTVDHRLDPESGHWTQRARAMAETAGAGWCGLAWTGPKPSSGLSSAARTARHRLIAEAARALGAGVVLMAHTADDRAEAAWMRAQGSSVGEPSPWAPSPVWPEGRGLMILRPLLEVSRADLRAWLNGCDATWIDDPANGRTGSLRAEARRALAGRQPAPLGVQPPPPVGVSASDGVIAAPASTAWLGPILTCVSGRVAPPRSQRLEALLARLATGAPLSATLGGATVVSDGATLIAAREIGRRKPDLLRLSDTSSVWDGRFEVSATEPGWRIAAASGCRARLSKSDRSSLDALPAHARPAHPVLFRGDDPSPVLADEAVKMRDLVPDRLRLATGGVRREADLFPPAMALAPVASYL